MAGIAQGFAAGAAAGSQGGLPQLALQAVGLREAREQRALQNAFLERQFDAQLQQFEVDTRLRRNALDLQRQQLDIGSQLRSIEEALGIELFPRGGAGQGQGGFVGPPAPQGGPPPLLSRSAGQLSDLAANERKRREASAKREDRIALEEFRAFQEERRERMSGLPAGAPTDPRDVLEPQGLGELLGMAFSGGGPARSPYLQMSLEETLDLLSRATRGGENGPRRPFTDTRQPGRRY